MTIKHLVLSGGGAAGFTVYGALKYLNKNNFLKRSKNFENGISLAGEDFNDDLKIKNMKTSDEKLLAQIEHIKFRRFEEIYAEFKEL